MSEEKRYSYSRLLDNIAGELDISPSKYKIAVERYTAVGHWLENGDYNCQDIPRIYPQGSFRIGTVVRPIRNSRESDYDIDLVCELQLDKESISPKDMKSSVGDCLLKNTDYQKMLAPEGKRCWTLEYAEDDGVGFHLDILPCIPESEGQCLLISTAGVPYNIACQSIAITDKNEAGHYDWSSGNPGGYGEWFSMMNGAAFQKIVKSQKQILVESNSAVFKNVDEVPDQLVRTPLQRAIQILKRHRDIRFAGHLLEDEKPISMIITTLAAKLYGQEDDTYSALSNIVMLLDAHASLLVPGGTLNESIASRNLISRRPDDTWFIGNPTNPAENFADRWHENEHRKAKAFFRWISWVRQDLVDVLNHADLGVIVKLLEPQLGERVVTSAYREIQAAGAPTIMPITHTKITNPSKPWGRYV
ncbi:MAG: nucleotidyltransferase domain-containing protein [Armatimonadota bacterium]